MFDPNHYLRLLRDRPALCHRRNRPWFWLVPPSYQEYLDLPVSKVAGVLAKVDAGVVKPVPVKLGEGEDA